MHKFFRRGIFLIFPITILCAALALVMIAQCFHLDDSRIHVHFAHAFSDGWQQISSAESAANDEIIFQNTLPEIDDSDYELCFRSDSERVRVFVDSEQIYSYSHHNRTTFGSWFGSIWNLVSMKPEYSGKTIIIEFIPLSTETYNDYDIFFLDHHGDIVLTLLLHSWPIITNFIIGLVTCFTLLISGFLHLRAGSKTARARIFLGIFIMLSQIYIFCDAGLPQYLIANKAISHYTLYCALMLLPVPFALYLSEISPRWSYHCRVISLFYCGYFMLRLLLYVSGIAELDQCLALTLTLIVLGLALAAMMCISDPSRISNRIMLAGILIFCPFALGAIMLYLSGNATRFTTPLYSLTLAIGIDVMMIFFYAAMLKSSVSTANRAEKFEQQAYTDALTQIYNRAAFNLTQPTLLPGDHPRLTLLMMDLNNLKQVNDTLGHPAGDKLICILTQCMREAFDEIGDIYRYGGDEFVVVIPDASLAEAREARMKLEQLLLQHRQHGGYEISAAIGMASRQFPGYANKSAAELLRIADAAMYQAKSEQKADPDFTPALHKRLDQVDALTGILSFPAFKTRVYDALMSRANHCPCIVNFDLNFFDGYNKLFGWNAGNLLLQKMTQMAMRLCGDNGFCAHDFADSFWVFVNVPDLDTLTQRISQQTRDFQANLDDCLLFPSFGIYSISDRMLPVSDMCSRAASAKKRIKGHLDVLYSVYSTEEHQRRTDNMKLISYMQKALDSDEFVPYYQPKFKRSGALAGAEALVRWPRGKGEPSSPAEFTALFEKSGLILSLDWYMLEKSCRFLEERLADGLECVPISINFSRLHIFEADCLERVIQITDSHHVPHQLIEIELTETALVEDSARIFDLISALQAEHFSVSLDDFGSGISSLGSLNNLRVDTIKIDRSLIDECDPDLPNNAIFEFVVALCKRLKIHTLAEGVETQAQFDRLCKCGCELVQGNYFSAALSQQDFEALLRSRQTELKSPAAKNN